MAGLIAIMDLPSRRALSVHITLQINKEGTLTIPSEVVKALGFSPEQVLVLCKDIKGVRIEELHLERLERIGELVRTALTGVTWNEIEAEREDRCI